MTNDEKIAFDNIKKLLINGKFELTGIEAIAFAKAFSVMDQFVKRQMEPVVMPAPVSAPIEKPRKGKRGDNNKLG